MTGGLNREDRCFTTSPHIHVQIHRKAGKCAASNANNTSHGGRASNQYFISPAAEAGTHPDGGYAFPDMLWLTIVDRLRIRQGTDAFPKEAAFVSTIQNRQPYAPDGTIPVPKATRTPLTTPP